MSDKFLQSPNPSVTDGTINIWAGSITSNNLDPSRPVKTNATKKLISSNLEISEINQLSASLQEKLDLTLVNTAVTPSLPPFGKVKIYSKVDDKFYTLDSAGNEFQLSGDVNGLVSSTDLSMTFFDGTTGKKIKEVTGYKYNNGTSQLEAKDITVDGFLTSSPNTNGLKGLRLTSGGSGVIQITAPIANSAYNLRLPLTQGINGSVLTNDGFGNLTFVQKTESFTVQGGVGSVGGNAEHNASKGHNACDAPLVMVYDCELTGAAVSMRIPRTGGTLTLRFYKNGSQVFPTGPIQINATTPQYAYNTFLPISFNAGDLLQFSTETSSFTPTGDDATIILFLRRTV